MVSYDSQRESVLSGGLIATGISRFGRYKVDFKAAEGESVYTRIQIHSILSDFKDKNGGYIRMMVPGSNPSQIYLAVDTKLDDPSAPSHYSFKLELGFNAAESVHSYSFEWLPDRVLFFVDGEEVHRYEPGEEMTTGSELPDESAIPLFPGIFQAGVICYGDDESLKKPEVPAPVGLVREASFTTLSELEEYEDLYPVGWDGSMDRHFFNHRNNGTRYPELRYVDWLRLYPRQASLTDFFQQDFPYAANTFHLPDASGSIEPELVEYAKTHSAEEVRQRIKAGGNPDAIVLYDSEYERYFSTLIGIYIGKRDIEMVRFLLENGGGSSRDLNLELGMAVSAASVEILALLCEAGAPLAAADTGPSLVRFALYSGNPDWASALVGLGALANIADLPADDRDILTEIGKLAATQGNLEIVALLDSAGIGYSPEMFVLAAEHNRNEIFRFLLSSHVIPDEYFYADSEAIYDGAQTLNWLLRNGNMEIIALLDDLGYTLYPWIAGETMRSGNVSMLRYLVENLRLDPFGRSYRPAPGTGFAVFEGYPQRKVGIGRKEYEPDPAVIEYLAGLDYSWTDDPYLLNWLMSKAPEHPVLFPLLETVLKVYPEADLNENSDFRSALFEHGNPEAVEYALKLGMDPSIVLGKGTDRAKSLLINSVLKRDLDLIRLLIDAGADVDWENADGQTARSLALEAALPPIPGLITESDEVNLYAIADFLIEYSDNKIAKTHGRMLQREALARLKQMLSETDPSVLELTAGETLRQYFLNAAKYELPLKSEREHTTPFLFGSVKAILETGHVSPERNPDLLEVFLDSFLYLTRNTQTQELYAREIVIPLVDLGFKAPGSNHLMKLLDFMTRWDVDGYPYGGDDLFFESLVNAGQTVIPEFMSPSSPKTHQFTMIRTFFENSNLCSDGKAGTLVAAGLDGAMNDPDTGESLLQIALADRGQSETIEALLDGGAVPRYSEPEEIDLRPATEIHYYVGAPYPEMTFNSNESVDVPLDSKRLYHSSVESTPFPNAFFRGEFPGLRKAASGVRYGHNPKYPPKFVDDMNSDLVASATLGHSPSVLAKMIAAGAETDEFNQFGFTALDYAMVSLGGDELVELLYYWPDESAIPEEEPGVVDPNYHYISSDLSGSPLFPLTMSDNVIGFSPLMFALSNSTVNPWVIRGIIEGSPENQRSEMINHKSLSGNTALILAVWNGMSREILEILLEYGADPYVWNKVGVNVFLLADFNGIQWQQDFLKPLLLKAPEAMKAELLDQEYQSNLKKLLRWK
nr:family 16 glycosylhydrolase [Spirochaeta isovalerica]